MNKQQEREHEEEDQGLHALLTASPRCWENPGVLGFNKLRARTTLGAFSSVHQARWGRRSSGRTSVLFSLLRSNI